MTYARVVALAVAHLVVAIAPAHQQPAQQAGKTDQADQAATGKHRQQQQVGVGCGRRIVRIDLHAEFVFQRCAGVGIRLGDAQLVALDMRDRGIVEHQLDLAGDKVRRGLGGPATPYGMVKPKK